MRLLLTLVASVALASLLVLLAGCSGDSSSVGTGQLTPEQQDIQAVLEASEYALPEAFHSDEEYQVQGGPILTQYGEEGEDILPWVRFFRVIRGRPWSQYVIRIPGSSGPGTADVRILQHISGGFIVDNTDDSIINPFYRRLGSVAVTQLVLNKVEGTWRIAKISPTDIVSTNDGGTTIHIEGIRTQGSSRTYPQTIIMSADSLLALDQLPAFAPGDTIMVAAKAVNRDEDGSWLFLHVHCGHHAAFFHGRVPFVRDDSDPTMFYARWVLPSGVATPRVFHMAVDAIDWNTLFGDETAVYNSRMWSLPCVVGFTVLAEQ